MLLDDKNEKPMFGTREWTERSWNPGTIIIGADSKRHDILEPEKGKIHVFITEQQNSINP